MKKRYFLALIAAMLFFIISPNYTFTADAAADATHPGFRVEGRYLYDNQGEKVILYGVNKMCTWTDKDGDPSFKEISKTGANCVRITWSISDTAKDLDTVITNCRAQHMIPIIEVHDATGEWSKLTSLVDYWVKSDIAEVLIKHQDYLIVNIGNEVGNGNITDTQFTDDYTTAVTRMRAAGINSTLMIDGSTWGQNINILQSCGPALIQADPNHNLLFSVHMWWPYMYGHTAQEVIDELNESVEMNLPLVVGEFGHEWEESEQGKIPYETIMEYCAKLNIGYIAWSWGPGNNPQTFLDMTTDSTFDTLNAYGTEVCLTSDYSIQKLAKRPDSMLTNLPPKMPSEPLPYGNLAEGKMVTGSSVESTGYEAANVTDGDLNTRWASTNTDPNWVCIDLGAKKELSKMIIVWEAAYASQYRIQVSDDGTTWTDAYITYSGKGGTEEISLDASGRYVRMYGTQRYNYSWGYSIFEIGVYGPESELSTSITPTVAAFDKNPSKQTDLIITTVPKDNTLIAIRNSTDVLVNGTDYTVDGTIVTISKEYLSTQPFDETIKLTFDYDNGVDPVLAVAIGDTSPVTAISPTTAEFNKYTAAQKDINVTLSSTEITVADIVNGSYTLVNGVDYTLANSTIKISKTYLATLSTGSVQLTFTFSDGSTAILAIKVIYTVPDAAITPTTESFEKRAQADVNVTMDLNGNSLVSIKNGTYTLVENTDYIVTDTIITIKKEYLATLNTGVQTLVFGFDQGNDATIKITVTETIPNSILDQTTISYNSDEAADVTVSITLNGNTLAAIKNGSYTLVAGTDYIITGNTVTIMKEYLTTLTDATIKLTFLFSEGANQELTLKNTSVVSSTLKLSTQTNAWSSGYTMNVYIENTSDLTVNSWKLTVKKSDFAITNIWCAQVTEVGDYYIITPMSWNQSISAGSSVNFGFQGTGTPVADFTYTLE
ncbi:X2-like carbohydrate binding domain-containing protein [Anaeromicropila populeti]|uniref:cellulase n=1 Tax=Anaeromicropila populeti TaxID=37658 RepID=A0A1I6L1G5_9FIRM|nr:X2-like carbohydrate binding domain-containing protein [Anaeromicropila populeti]SFR97281.1 mannan endo-1,4-beta-mannosidase [Anaeromicropila populeti]